MTRPLFPDLATLGERLANGKALWAVTKAALQDAELSPQEAAALEGVEASSDALLLKEIRAVVRAGGDPLGDAYCAVQSAVDRRHQGQTFTPQHVVKGMLDWARRRQPDLVRVVDPGAGSGRYTLAALRAFPRATAIAVEMDPRVAVLLRANLVFAGMDHRAQVLLGDFRDLVVPPAAGPTLWIGNPPYVRHHDITADWKVWYSATLRRFGHEGSQLAGLHLHFFLKTLELAVPGDIGCYVTAAEWLDVNYGSALRGLLTNGLGGESVFVVDPQVQVFGDALVTAAITCFAPGAQPPDLRFSEVASDADLASLGAGHVFTVAAAKAEPKWSLLVRGGRSPKPEGFVELGELFKVSRGQVTGANRVWVHGAGAPVLPPRFLVPAITDSADITRAAGVIDSPDGLRNLVCLPPELKELEDADRKAVERFLRWARQLGAHDAYVAKQRKPWWSLARKSPPAAVMTYMGRRAPAFASNRANAQLINIAHGLYPRQPMTQAQIQRVVAWLNQNASTEQGRVYAGGLTKFEPSEAMRILVPAELAA